MDSKRESKLNMFHQVVELCENNLLIIALVPAFETAYLAFKTIVTAIVVVQTQLDVQSGAGAAKKISKRDLATLGSGIAGMIYAYASVIADADLKAAMNISFSKINKALDDDVISICTSVHAKATALGVALADYGVSPALLLTFQGAIDDYAGKAPKPRQTRVEKRVLLQQAKQMEKDATTIMEERMNRLVVNFILNGNAVFEGKYQAATVIIDPGSFSTVLKIQVVNAANQQPIRGAKSYRDASPTFKKSSTKGLVTYKDIEEGGHTFVMKKKGFQDLTVSNVMIAHGHKVNATAVMIPVGGVGSPAGDPPGFDIVEFHIPDGGFIVIPLPNPIPPGTQFYFRSIGGNAVISTTNLPAGPGLAGYQLNEGTPFQGDFSTLNLNMTLTHIEIANPGSDGIVVRVGTSG